MEPLALEWEPHRAAVETADLHINITQINMLDEEAPVVTGKNYV